MKRLILVIALPLLIGAGPCSETRPVSGTVPISGTILLEGVIRQGVGPECGQTWGIATADGNLYWPVKDPAFHEEGMRVKFSAHKRPDLASICMAGTIVDVVSIEKL